MDTIHTTSEKNTHKNYIKQPNKKTMVPKCTLGIGFALILSPMSVV